MTKNNFNIKEIFINKVSNQETIKNNILEKKKEEREMKKYIKYGIGGLVVCLAIGAIIIKSNNKVMEVDYIGYLAAAKPVQLEKSKIQANMDMLDKNYAKNKVNDNDYFNQMELLKNKYNEVIDKEDTLKKEYKLDKELNLNKVKFSNNEEEDKELKKIYKLKNELEKKDEELDILEDNLENDYKSGKITKEIFLAKKNELEQRDEELDKEEDRLDALEDKYDTEDDDDNDEELEDDDIEDNDVDNENDDDKLDKTDD